MAGWTSLGPLNKRPWALFVALAVLLSVLAFGLPLGATIRISVVGKLLGKEQLAAQSVTMTIIVRTAHRDSQIVYQACGLALYLGMSIFSLMSGATAKVARFKAARQASLVGQQINLIFLFLLIWSVVLTAILFGLMEPLFDLFRPADHVRELARSFYLKFMFAEPLMVAMQMAGSMILGLRKYLVQFGFAITATGLDIAAIYALFYGFHAQSNDVLAYATITIRGVLLILAMIFFYRPSMRRKYKMCPLKIEKSVLKNFVIDSGFLFGRGLIIMLTYFGSPLAASRLGTIPLDAHSIMANLFMYPVLIGDSIGTASNIVGSRFLGHRQFGSFRRLVKFGALAGFIVGGIFALIFSLLREHIIHSFTNDEEIHAAMRDCWWLLVGTAAMAPIVGIFEGLGTARHYFKTLFFVILVAVGGVYLPIIIYNSFTYRTLSFIWTAIIGLEFMRGLPIILTTLWGMRNDSDRDELPSLEGQDRSRDINETERTALLSSDVSINTSDYEQVDEPGMLPDAATTQ